jgi:hypothetical protein
VKRSIGGFIHNPVSRLLFNVWAIVAKFEPDLIRVRTSRSRPVVSN